MFSLSVWLPLFFKVNALVQAESDPVPAWSQNVLETLNITVGGRLFRGVPFAHPCFDDSNSTACSYVQAGYLDESFRANSSSAYMFTEWETCQTTGAQCLLDFTNPHDLTPTLPPNQCQIGSVPNYFIDVRTSKDVTVAFEFSRRTRVPLVIKNTGHDYKGRSSAPGSLALWTHHLKDISYNSKFIPEGCSKTSPGVTFGAGVQWGEAYAFADVNNITLVGGSDKAVGVSGGWLQGGGHGALSNTMGLGVDRVLQFKLVTPDGRHRVANACQNADLFFALRGGGGGTFGVVLESTVLASPRVVLQAAVVAWKNANSTLTNDLWPILIDNGLKWAGEGWGGFATPESAIYVTPKLSKAEAAVSMAPLIQFGEQLQSDGVVGTQNVAAVGLGLALTSRLIDKSNFNSSSDRSALLSGLLAANAATPGIIILISPPTSFPGDGQTSITDAWRTSVYHVVAVSQWNWNATVAEKKAQYKLASQSIDNLRRITNDAAYLNEADVYEPNHEGSFILGDTLPRAAENQTKIVCPFTSFRRTTANARLATLTISWTAGNAWAGILNRPVSLATCEQDIALGSGSFT